MAKDTNLDRQAGRPKLPADEVKMYTHSLRIDQETEQKLLKQAKKEETTITNIIIKALKEYFKEENIKKDQ